MSYCEFWCLGSFSGGGLINVYAYLNHILKEEFYAINTLAIVAQTLATLSIPLQKKGKTIAEPQLTRAVNALARRTSMLISDEPERILEIFAFLIEDN